MAGDAIPKSIVITPDEKFLLALCHNGTIIRYSLDYLSISDQIKTDFDVSNFSFKAVFEFIGNNEVIISNDEKAIFVNYASMEIRAKIDCNYIGFIPSSRRIIMHESNSSLERKTLYYYKYLTTEELIESAKRFAGLD